MSGSNPEFYTYYLGNVSPPLTMSMNSSVNRLSESSQPPGDPTPETSNLPSMSEDTQDTQTNKLETTTSTSLKSVTSESELKSENILRKHPIPPPSDPKQYRAIGLVAGKYQPSVDQLTRGTLVTTDDTLLEAVLLGRLISLVKNHLDLEQEHLWVVYPRTRQEDEHLHVQLVGVWAPEILAEELPKTGIDPSDQEEATTEASTAPSPIEIKNCYFSIRGEAIFFDQEKEKVVVRIRQAPRPGDDKPRMFKLELKGTLPSERPIYHFWDLQVQLRGNDLCIEQATDIGILPIKKKDKFSRKNFKGGRNTKFSRPQGGRGRRSNSYSPRPSRKDSSTPKPIRSGKVVKPILKKKGDSPPSNSPAPQPLKKRNPEKS